MEPLGGKLGFCRFPGCARKASRPWAFELQPLRGKNAGAAHVTTAIQPFLGTLTDCCAMKVTDRVNLLVTKLRLVTPMRRSSASHRRVSNDSILPRSRASQRVRYQAELGNEMCNPPCAAISKTLESMPERCPPAAAATHLGIELPELLFQAATPDYTNRRA